MLLCLLKHKPKKVNEDNKNARKEPMSRPQYSIGRTGYKDRAADNEIVQLIEQGAN